MRCFESGLTERSIQEFITTGHYTFAEYAIAYWSEHLLATIRALNAPDIESLAHVIEAFLRIHFSPTTSTQPVPKPIEKAISKFQQYAFYENLGQAIALLENRKGPNPKPEKSINNLDLEDILSRIRSLMETMSLSEKTRESLERIHGPKIFKCSRIDCTSFVEGFSNLDDCRRHQERHDRRFHCTFDGCVAADLGFASLVELQRHLQRLHDPSRVPGFPCYKEPDYREAVRAIKEANLPVIERYLQIEHPKDKLITFGNRHMLYNLWHTAVLHPDNEVLSLLIRHTQFQGTDAQRKIVLSATAARQADLVRRFVSDEFRELDTTSTRTWRHAIASAISHDEVDILRILVGPDPSKLSSHSLRQAQLYLVDACKSGSFFCVRYLVLECGLNPFEHSKLRRRTTERTRDQVLKELRRREPFYNAIAAGHAGIVEYFLNLVDYQPERYSKLENREDFLAAAAVNGREELVEMLANHKFAIDKVMTKRYAVMASLYNGVRYGKEELVTELLPLAEPDYDLPDRHGCSMLMYAAFNGLEHAVEYLLQKGADFMRKGDCPEANLTTRSTQTALVLAVLNGHDQIVHRLLQCPLIDVSGYVRFRQGRPGWHNLHEVAELKGHTTIAQLLRDHQHRAQTVGAPSQNQYEPGVSPDVSLAQELSKSDRDILGRSSDDDLQNASSESGEDGMESYSPADQ